MKTCFKCSTKKPLADFYRHSAMADGYLNKCKQCTKKDVHQHRHGDGREKVLAYDRERAKNSDRISKTVAINKRWREAHPERRKAHNIVARAVAIGTLHKWPVCCLPECNKKPEAHHPDYSRPLDVVWLCAEHHKHAHFLMEKE